MARGNPLYAFFEHHIAAGHGADSVPAQFPTAGPVLVVQGLADQIMPAATEAACVREKLVAAGVDVDQCVFPFATHVTIMDHHPRGVAWAESVLAGGPRARCDQSAQLPACAP